MIELVQKVATALKLLVADARSSRGVTRIALYFGMALTVISIVNSAHDGLTYSGGDLRIRVVGARAMALGMNPYRLDQTTYLPDTLRDPDQAVAGLTRCTYPPSLLLYYLPLAWLPWRLARVVSMVLEWMALMSMVAVLITTLRNRRLRLIFLVVALAGFAGTNFWRLHVERGQYHVFVVLLLALTVGLLSRDRRDRWTTGVPLGLAMAVRPTVAIVLLTLLLARSRRIVVAAVASATAVVVLTLPFGGLRLWVDWQSLVDRYEAIFSGSPDPQVQQFPDDARVAAEGYIPGRLMPANTQNSSGIGIAALCARIAGWSPTPERVRWIVRASVATVLGAMLVLYLLANRRRGFCLRYGLHYGIVVSMVGDLLAPIRFGYADIQFLLPIAFALPLLLRTSARVMAVAILLGLASGSFSFVAPFSWDITRTLLLLLPIVLVYTCTVVTALRRADGTRVIRSGPPAFVAHE